MPLGAGLIGPEKVLELSRWKWFRVKEALHFFAVLGPKEGCLGGRLDAFGDDLQAKIMRHDDNGTYDGGVLQSGLIGDFSYETLINLDSRERISRQITQRGIASTEVIEGEANSSCSKYLQRR